MPTSVDVYRPSPLTLSPTIAAVKPILSKFYIRERAFIMAPMTVDQILRVPAGEIKFTFPGTDLSSAVDKKYETLRIRRRGLRKWDCFEEDPAHLQAYLQNVTPYCASWKPCIVPWQRLAASERMVQDLYALTLIHRVNVALDSAVPRGLCMIGTPRHFPSWGNENSRSEGQEERNTIAPDWALVVGDGDPPPGLEVLGEHIIALGDTKLRRKDDRRDSPPLPGTQGCAEAYLTQVVQYCIDMNVPFGFVLTNLELVVFQVSRHEPGGGREPIVTRSSHRGPSAWQVLPSDATVESEFSSPLKRQKGDWVDFEHGDDVVPYVSKDLLLASAPVPSNPGPSQPAQTQTQTQRHTTPEIPSSSQPSSLSLGSSPPTLGGGGRASSPYMSSPFTLDVRAEDPNYVFIRSYAADDEGIARRLFEFCMLAKTARDRRAGGIGPWKVSFAALDALDR
ncbi:hypothetical protein EKO27_g11396 [Xylaria grammica]|uniref:Uncharacterized protein n=1 Tax=Xylaria grammica TaxID=363999 RepID=A0A439CNH5_9PEZI|nr:hypothetical protein EKO27_g11396 [Xylaria grammica]